MASNATFDDATPRSPIIQFSDDDELIALQAMSVMLKHMSSKRGNITPDQMQVVTRVQILTRTLKVKSVTLTQIANALGMDRAECETIVNEAVHLRYLHCLIPTFGDKVTYKIGPLGGTILNRATGRLTPKTKKPNVQPRT